MPKVRDPETSELRPYGYAPGNYTSWCASCGFTFHNAQKRAFKCRKCAVEQWREVERICISRTEQQSDLAAVRREQTSRGHIGGLPVWARNHGER